MSDPNFGNYYYVKVAARCVINNIPLPMSSVALVYGINSIPVATVSLPIGRVAGGNAFDSISNAMTFLLNLQPFTTVQIFATLTASPSGRATPNGPVGFPDGKEFLIFDGFIKSPGAVNTFNSASIEIECMGKTAALAGSTQMINGSIEAVPTNGGTLAVSFFGGGLQATLQDALVKQTGGKVTDLWNGLLKIVFDDVLPGLNAWNDPKDPATVANNFADQAIKRINTFKALSKAGSDVNIDISSAPTDLIARQICATAMVIFYDTWANNNGTLWQATLATANEFGFKYITAIEDDGILPVFYGLGGDPWRTIKPNEYEQIRLDSRTDEEFFSYPTKVGLFSTITFSNPWQGTSPPTQLVGIGSVGETALSGTGRLVLRQAPHWLMPPAAPGQATTQPGGAVPDASNPTPIPVNDYGIQEAAYFAGLVGNNYANAVLYDMMFSHRTAVMSGRIRFDIAPGSLLQIITPGERFTGEQSELWGHVSAVKIDISLTGQGNTGYARTGFALTNIRTKKEHATLTLPKHPVFAQAWMGGKLSAEA